jgi:hypothetical protein
MKLPPLSTAAFLVFALGGFSMAGLMAVIIKRADDQINHLGQASEPHSSQAATEASCTPEIESDEPSLKKNARDELFVYPGLDLPETVPAIDAHFPDAEDVIGVVVGSQARAYRLRVMKGPRRHVINDVISGVPISVVYCDITGCITAFTSKTDGGPLDLDLGGWHSGNLVLKVGDRLFYQKSREPLPYGAFADQGWMDSCQETQPFPYHAYPFVRTTWSKWKEAHPDTDVHWINWHD